jgi:uncharacterized protein (DUF433 family)
MRNDFNQIFETPIYGMVDAAHYLRVPYQTLRYWTIGRDNMDPIVHLVSYDPPRLSFMNLMECHMLSGMRKHYNLRLPKVRSALRTLARMYPSPYPLIDKQLETDSVDVFIREHGNELLNLNRPEQRGFRQILETHIQRIEKSPDGMLSFFPFVEKRSPDEPRMIMINPAVSFGRPVISGTAIPTAVIASRFHAREPLSDLAREYGRAHREIEEAIRWESKAVAA